ncbi:MAG: nickel pincer cofactor biosynthesis protein LarC [Candidatus Bathyarchaeota archaeon]|uniref:nickel pincer cofactor biosynthesis protein LarC n=1 Tax=Candidatus Bathycorpusculum sp. TaxID=2994959 RepID=UPI002839C143|nr:nickel pincer cofactor biosynthesis protein LarC [Candidatus Termiticorpusculum sp.]MCL2257564.1 nickel pincer cofactor biosynthesis protein LarC [Candidatus Termiticorpusculum sp.]MCL2292301.1 nickel pincer cofactor biosynthesis protein LarC [Candidatus Termiticorpusculum sp.]
MTELSSSIIVIIDCQTAGVAGDMFLGALLDLGADVTKVTCAIKRFESAEYGYSNIKVDIKQVMTNGFKATKVSITSDKSSSKNGVQLIDMIDKTVQHIDISSKAKHFATNTIRSLITAEAGLHGGSLHDIHLHEVGLVDTVAEIIGCAVAMDDLGFFNAQICTTPVAVGGGLFKFSHGITSSPSPATLAILQSKNFPIKGGPIEAELATPTGAALLVNLTSESIKFYPEMIPTKIGYGAGDKVFSEIPNIIRITMGKPLEAPLYNDNESVAVLETSIDDVSGEVIGYVFDRLLHDGAKDVSVLPVFTKKNRPAQLIKVISDLKDVQHLAKVLIEETGTLGVRVYYCKRYVLTRDVYLIDLTVSGQKETVKIKCSKNNQGKIIRLKPEFEDLKQLAKKTGLPLRELADLVTAKAQKTLLSDYDGNNKSET